MSKKILFILLILVGICAISHVSAEDVLDDGETQTLNDNVIEEVVGEVSDDENPLKSTHNLNSGDDIQAEINSASEGPRTGVVVSALDEPYWRRHYSSSGRFLPSYKMLAEEM